VLGIFPGLGLAGIETDKNAGICSAYLIARSLNEGAQAALNMADNQKRATQFGLNWMRDLKKAQADKTSVEGLIFEGSAACRKVSIRPGDYKK
jgi:hypothetical protein